MPRPLLLSFMREIRYDCHGLVARYCRSEAGGRILQNPAENFPLVRDFLANLPEPTDNIERDERMALTMLLDDMGKKLGYTPFSGTSFAHTSAWLKWAYEQCPAQVTTNQIAAPN